MHDLTIAALTLAAGSGLAAVIGFPLAMLDNPQRRRRKRNRRRRGS